MLFPLVKSRKPSEKIWNASPLTIAKNINRLKHRIAVKLSDSNLPKITDDGKGRERL